MSGVGDPAVLATSDRLGDDWFAEGTAFDSGESLAAALIALAGAVPRPLPAVREPAPPAAPVPGGAGLAGAAPYRMAPPPEAGAGPTRSTIPAAAPPARGGGAEPAGEFQVAAMPSFEARTPDMASDSAAEPPGWGRAAVTVSQAAPRRTGWSIRQSVQVLRVTEDILQRLREEAAELTWGLAAEVLLDAEGGPALR